MLPPCTVPISLTIHLPSSSTPALSISGSTGSRADPLSDAREISPTIHDSVCRRKARHTTHHQELPPSVTITRSHHAFEGQSLVVQGRVHRQARVHLLLVLPDGSRSLIPAEWTDLQSSEHTSVADLSAGVSLAPLSELLHARTIVDALLHKLPASDEAGAGKHAGKERQRATESGHSGGTDPRQRRVGIAERGTTKGRRRGAGTADCAGSDNQPKRGAQS